MTPSDTEVVQSTDKQKLVIIGNGMAPGRMLEHLLEQVGALKKRGLTILLAEQAVDFTLALADRVYVLEKGAVVHAGSARELREDAGLRERLLAL